MHQKLAVIRIQNLKLSDSQEKLIDDRLTDYCAELWWNFTYEYDKKYVREVVISVATKGIDNVDI